MQSLYYLFCLSSSFTGNKKILSAPEISAGKMSQGGLKGDQWAQHAAISGSMYVDP